MASDVLQVAEKQIYIDTFAGAGGSSLGLRGASWHGLFAVEIDPMAFETLQRNFLVSDAPYPHFQNWPAWILQKPLDMRQILVDQEIKNRLIELRGKISLVIGGPPCQGFSVGGARRGTDARNDLVFTLLDMVEIILPPYVIIENVVGITRPFTSRPGSTDESIANLALDRLRSLNYVATYVVVNAVHFGVPQTRERVIILGISRELLDNNTTDIQKLFSDALTISRKKHLTDLGLPLDRPTTVGEALHDLSGTEFVVCPDSIKFEASKFLEAQSLYAKWMRDGIPTGAIPNSHRFNKHGKQVYDLYIKAHQTQRPGRLSKEFLLTNGTRTNKKFLLDPAKPSSTLTTHPDEFIHYLYPRSVTLREMARLQSFPDKFYFYGRYTLNGDRRGLDVSRCAQIGNAIPPFLGKVLGLALTHITNLIRSDEIVKYQNGVEKAQQLALF